MEATTIFLLVCGVLAFVPAFMNYDWFFETGEVNAAVAVGLLGRKLSRALFVLIGLVCISLGIWRMMDPPREIPTGFVEALGKPQGIDLNSQTALSQLQSAEGGIRDLEVLGTEDWGSFWTVLPQESPHFVDARDSAVSGPDFRKGFSLRAKSLNQETYRGRIIYLDANDVSCDNMLFSKHPLSSAEFVMVICDEKASEGLNGLRVVFAKRGSELFEVLDL